MVVCKRVKNKKQKTVVDDFEGFMSKAAFHALKTDKIAPGGHV